MQSRGAEVVAAVTTRAVGITRRVMVDTTTAAAARLIVAGRTPVRMAGMGGTNSAHRQRCGRPARPDRGRSPVTAAGCRSCRKGRVRLWQILLQKSFWGGERKFLEPLMRLTGGDVRDHIVSPKIEHGSGEGLSKRTETSRGQKSSF